MSDCDRFLELLVERLCGALDAAGEAELAEHLAGCGACRAAAGDWTALLAAHRGAGELDAPAEASRRVLEAARRGARPRVRRTALLALAAVLLAAAGAWLVLADAARVERGRYLADEGARLRGSGEAFAARDRYRAAAELLPGDPALLHRLGELELELGDAGAAALVLGELIDAHPAYPERRAALGLLAEALASGPDPGGAVAALDRLAREFPDSRDEVLRRLRALELRDRGLEEPQELMGLGYLGD